MHPTLKITLSSLYFHDDVIYCLIQRPRFVSYFRLPDQYIIQYRVVRKVTCQLINIIVLKPADEAGFFIEFERKRSNIIIIIEYCKFVFSILCTIRTL